MKLCLTGWDFFFKNIPKNERNGQCSNLLMWSVMKLLYFCTNPIFRKNLVLEMGQNVVSQSDCSIVNQLYLQEKNDKIA